MEGPLGAGIPFPEEKAKFSWESLIQSNLINYKVF